jgi:hypothetical protein
MSWEHTHSWEDLILLSPYFHWETSFQKERFKATFIKPGTMFYASEFSIKCWERLLVAKKILESNGKLIEYATRALLTACGCQKRQCSLSLKLQIKLFTLQFLQSIYNQMKLKMHLVFLSRMFEILSTEWQRCNEFNNFKILFQKLYTLSFIGS